MPRPGVGARHPAYSAPCRHGRLIARALSSGARPRGDAVMPPRKRWPSSPRRSEQRYAKHGSCANPPPPSSCPRRASAPNSPGSRLEGQFQPYRPLDGQVGGFAALWIQSTELAVRRKRSTRSPPRRRPAAFTTMPEDTHPGSLGVAVGTATTRGSEPRCTGRRRKRQPRRGSICGDARAPDRIAPRTPDPRDGRATLIGVLSTRAGRPTTIRVGVGRTGEAARPSRKGG
jgi:hypothetical protein